MVRGDHLGIEKGRAEQNSFEAKSHWTCPPCLSPCAAKRPIRTEGFTLQCAVNRADKADQVVLRPATRPWSFSRSRKSKSNGPNAARSASKNFTYD